MKAGGDGRGQVDVVMRGEAGQALKLALATDNLARCLGLEPLELIEPVLCVLPKSGAAVAGGHPEKEARTH